MKAIALVLSILLLVAACTPTERVPMQPLVLQIPSHRQMPAPWPWRALSDRAAPDRELVRAGYGHYPSQRSTEIATLDYLSLEGGARRRVVGFSLTNDGSLRINPEGLRRDGPFRRYSFVFPDRARENIYLKITDDVALSGRYSQDNMFREMHFFPRRQLPSVHRLDEGRRLEVVLPTGEPVVFDARTGELAGGVLRERPIDFTRSRYERSDPRVSYHGNRLMITVAQRGEDPRRAEVWGRTKLASAHYPARYDRPCELSPGRIWDQRPKPGDEDPRLTMLHPQDASLFDLIERQCDWNLSDLRRPPALEPRPERPSMAAIDA